MPRIKLNVTLKTKNKKENWQVAAIKNDQQLIYKEDSQTTVIFNHETNELTRKRKEITMHFFFEEQKPFLLIELNDLEKTMHIPLNSVKIIKKETEITIEYSLEKELFIYKIEVIM